jgi:hypothetical protein
MSDASKCSDKCSGERLLKGLWQEQHEDTRSNEQKTKKQELEKKLGKVNRTERENPSKQKDKD